MKRILIFLMAAFLLLCARTTSASCLVKGSDLSNVSKKVPAVPPGPIPYLRWLAPHDYKLATGKKLQWKDKLILRLYKLKLIKYFPGDENITEKQRKLAKLSLIFGAGAFVLAILPAIGLLAIPSAITGIILGIISLKGNRNTNGILGIVFGGVFILILALIISLLALLFSGFR